MSEADRCLVKALLNSSTELEADINWSRLIDGGRGCDLKKRWQKLQGWVGGDLAGDLRDQLQRLAADHMPDILQTSPDHSQYSQQAPPVDDRQHENEPHSNTTEELAAAESYTEALSEEGLLGLQPRTRNAQKRPRTVSYTSQNEASKHATIKEGTAAAASLQTKAAALQKRGSIEVNGTEEEDVIGSLPAVEHHLETENSAAGPHRAVPPATLSSTRQEAKARSVCCSAARAVRPDYS